MIGIRLRFMDLLYAAVIGNSLQLLEPQVLDAKFFFGIFLLIVILEDFFLYYADVAPENSEAEGLSFLGMLSEIAVLSTWFFAFEAFSKDKWIFAGFLAAFFFLKVWSGFINCMQTKVLKSVKFARELLFLISVFLLVWIMVLNPETSPSDSRNILLWIGVSWLIQTISWWGVTKVFRSREGQKAILSMETAPHAGASVIAGSEMEDVSKEQAIQEENHLSQHQTEDADNPQIVKNAGAKTQSDETSQHTSPRATKKEDGDI